MSGWTAADLPDLSARTFVVTGANSGLGLATSRELARKGGTVVMACRNLARGEEAAQEIRNQVSGAKLDLEALDLADLASVRAFAERMAERASGIDVLINNAGVMALPRYETADGFEMQFGTNHLGHFALTGLLLDNLVKGDDPRVVTVSSGMHRTGSVNFDDLHGEHGYNRWRAYGQSKLSNLLFMYELDRRATSAGLPLRSVAAHPGYAATELQFKRPSVGLRAIVDLAENVSMKVGNVLFAQSAEMGALPTLYAATEDIPGGTYTGPDSWGEQRGHPTTVGSSRAARNEDDARHLWEASEELTGVRYVALERAAA